MNREDIDYFADKLATELAYILRGGDQPAQVSDIKLQELEQRLKNLEDKMVGVSDKVAVRKAFTRR